MHTHTRAHTQISPAHECRYPSVPIHSVCNLTCYTFTLIYTHLPTYPHTQFKQTRQYLRDAEGRFWEAVYILDYQFLFIPLVFTLLRMWTCIVGLLYVYIQIRETPDWLNVTLVYFAVSNGHNLLCVHLSYILDHFYWL